MFATRGNEPGLIKEPVVPSNEGGGAFSKRLSSLVCGASRTPRAAFTVPDSSNSSPLQASKLAIRVLAVQHPAPGLLPRGTLPKTAVAGSFRKIPWRRRPLFPESSGRASGPLIEMR